MKNLKSPLKRPKEVRLSMQEGQWSAKAMDAAFNGFNVHDVGDWWGIERHIYRGPSFTEIMSSDDTITDLVEPERKYTQIHRYSWGAEGLSVMTQPYIDRIAYELHANLEDLEATDVAIRSGSSRWEQERVLRVRWSLWPSIKFWIYKICERDISWKKVPGVVMHRIRVMIDLGWWSEP